MEPFIGQVLLFAGNFAPRGWAFCNGQLLPIAQNQALFSILGTMYGGDGRTTFALPDLRGRVPVHPGQGPGLSNYKIGEKGGAEKETLTPAQIPAHQHEYKDKTATHGTPSPTGSYYFSVGSSWGKPLPNMPDAVAEESVGNTSSVGSSEPHNNLPPYQCLNYIIALQGIYPSRS